jgi:hypothetical protein
VFQDAQDRDLTYSNQPAAGSSLWESFVNANTSNELCHAWLALVCEQISGASAAAVLVESREAQTYVPMAVWPEASPSLGRLAKVVETSLRERRGVVQSAALSQQAEGAAGQLNLAHLTQIAYPLTLDQRVIAVAVVEANCKAGDVNTILREIHWASAWL